MATMDPMPPWPHGPTITMATIPTMGQGGPEDQGRQMQDGHRGQEEGGHTLSYPYPTFWDVAQLQCN